jgi:integrase
VTRGSAREKKGRFYVRARFGEDERLELRAPHAKSIDDAQARATVVALVADKLVSIGRRDMVRDTAKKIAEAPTAKRVELLAKAVDEIVDGAKTESRDITFEQWAKRWTSGELAAQYPDHVRAIDHRKNVMRLRKYILRFVGSVPVVAFQLAYAEKVMAKLPEMTSTNRRHIAQIMVRLMHLAVYPGKLITASPIPRGWLPKVKGRKHYSCLYPREESALLACKDVPLVFRLFCGVLDREGMRISEAWDSTWTQWNLDEGTFLATKTKTGDPRAWALNPETLAAMREWKKREGGKSTRPFGTLDDHIPDRRKLAVYFRAALKKAGVDRAELFEATEHTAALRAHDMRATFVTVSLAEGRPEHWVRDRTAHKSTAMIDRYRRAARQWVELKLGGLGPLLEPFGWKRSTKKQRR